MAIVFIPTDPGYYAYRFICDRCKKQETNLYLYLLHVVNTKPTSQVGSTPTLILCRECHDSVEPELLSKGITGWDHLAHALVLAIGQSGFDDGEIKTLTGLLEPEN
jgi:hypothetical protein